MRRDEISGNGWWRSADQDAGRSAFNPAGCQGHQRPDSGIREGSHTSIDLFDPLRQLCNAQIPELGVDLS